jgi:hypothetical protein
LDALSPQKVQIGKISVSSVACGGHHTVILDVQGQIHTCGNNSYGQIGHKSSQNLSVPQLVHNISGKKIEQIACGWNHTLVWVPPYYVYSTGLGKYGELGLKNFEMRKGFMLIESLLGKNVIQIFAGGYHSWFLMDIECPDVEFEPPSPLLMTPALSRNEDTSSRKRLRSQDSNVSRKRRPTPEYRANLNDLRTFNIKSDDDFKKYEDLLNELKSGVGKGTRSEANYGIQSKQRYFEINDRHSDNNSKRTVGIHAVNNVNLRDEFGNRNSANNDFNNNKSLPMTPRAKMHQNVDKEIELMIPGYLSISSSDDDSPQHSQNKIHRATNKSIDNSLNLDNTDLQNKRAFDARMTEFRGNKGRQTHHMGDKTHEQDMLENSEFRLKQSSNDELYANLLLLKKQGSSENSQLTQNANVGVNPSNKPASFLNDTRKNLSVHGNNTNRSFKNTLELSEDSDISADIKIENLNFDDEENESPKPRSKIQEYAKTQTNNPARIENEDQWEQSQRLAFEVIDNKRQSVSNQKLPESLHTEKISMNKNYVSDFSHQSRPSLTVVDSDNIEILDAANKGHLFRGSFGLNVNAPENFFKQLNQELHAETQTNNGIELETVNSEPVTQEHQQRKSESQRNMRESNKNMSSEGGAIGETDNSFSNTLQLISQNHPRDTNKQDYNLIFTDLKYFHRFVIIYCDEKDNTLIRSITSRTIDYLRENDPKITVMDFLGSEEFCSIQSKQNYLNSFRIERIKGINSLILLILATADNLEKIQKQKVIPETNYSQFSCCKTAAGSMYKLSEKDVVADLRLKVLGRWYLTLKKNLTGHCSNLKFYELRPQTHR